ncbi:MAG: response regulator [Pseudomonadota bacterium]|nr:response regulator [Pseudomonadota bacterium]
MDGRKTGRLRKQLAGWFLAIGLLPWLLVAFISYQQSRNSLAEAAEDDLARSAADKIRFIESWFKYRWLDLNLQASDPGNLALLTQLKSSFEASGRSGPEFVQSPQWTQITTALPHHLNQVLDNYDYSYNLFLIDTEGNILFTVLQENDLGSNLFTGFLQQTRFAQAVARTLAEQQPSFSDYEHYAPSKNLLSSFLVAPMQDSKGMMQGAFALQIRQDQLNQALSSERGNDVYHYIVGTDGLLRSPLGQPHEILRRKVDTPPYRAWANGHSAANPTTYHYQSPLGNPVLGQYNPVAVENKRWVLISEIDQATAYAASNWLAKFDSVLLLISTLIIAMASAFFSKRIAQPIAQLNNAVEAFSRNESPAPMHYHSNNEIDILTENFNRMMIVRRRYEHQLETSEAAIRAALNERDEQQFALSHHAIVAITNIKGDILHVNSKFEEVSGYTSDELLGMNHRLLNSGYHPTSFFRDMYLTISKGNIWHGEICNRAKTGHLYWVATTIAPLRDNEGRIDRYIAIRTDITEQKAVQQELRDAKNAAEAAAKAKSEFLATMSHEIRTPMNGVLGMLDLLLRTKLTGDQQHQARLAMNSAESLLVIINDILDFSKIEAGKLDIEQIDFDLVTMLGDLVETIAPKAQHKRLELILDTVDIEHSMVVGDPGRLRQILSNLISNAIKFTEQGEIIVKAALRTTDRYQYRFECSVTDTGIGIPQDRMEHAFDSFTQVDASTTRRFGGTGLGLAIVKQLCQLMDGDIRVESPVQREDQTTNGSRFSFSINLQPSPLSRAVVPPADITNVPILVADDNATNREVLRRQLTLWGAKVDLASSSQQALERIDATLQNAGEHLYAVAFLDMQMPDLDGVRLGEIIRANPKLDAMKLIMMTSNGNRGDATKLARIGFNGYFPKPATTSDLSAALAVLLENGKALAQAAPLVTHHYLKSLELSHNDRRQQWPSQCRLLLVEDNSINLTVVQGMLKEFSLHCETANHGEEALELLQNASGEYPYTLVMMDCQMPTLDGYETTRRIRKGLAGERYRQLPIVAMTANAMSGDREKCLDAGMNDYLPKPISINRLHEKLCIWLKQERPEAAQDIAHLDGPTEAGEDSVWVEAEALKRVRNKPERLDTLISMFRDSGPQLIAEIRHHLGAGDAKDALHPAHTLKGVAGNLSAYRLMHAAEKLERLLRDNELDDLMPLVETIIQEHAQLLSRFDAYQNQDKPDPLSATP